MKEGLKAFTPYQVASLRMLFAGLVLLPFAIKAFRKIPKDKMGIVIVSGLIGNFIPAYLFCIAETRIDSALAVVAPSRASNAGRFVMPCQSDETTDKSKLA